MRALYYLSLFFFVSVTLVCLALSFRIINVQSTESLIIFNVVFVSLIFQLNGSLNRKLGLLTLGNLTGLCWNLTFATFSQAATSIFGKLFQDVYSIAFPFLNSVWIVSFWALSLTFLHRSKPNREVHV